MKGIGSVGAAVQWAYVGEKRDQVRFGYDVAGGAIALEPPNLINIAARADFPDGKGVQVGNDAGIVFKDISIRFEVEGSESRYSQPYEATCGVCGAPWPVAHKFCEVCVYEATADKQ
jgi:hypothetical protein